MRTRAKKTRGLKEAGESSVRGAKAFSDLAARLQGFRGRPGDLRRADGRHRRGVRELQEGGAGCVVRRLRRGPRRVRARRGAAFDGQAQAAVVSQRAVGGAVDVDERVPGALAAFGGNAAAAAAAAANPLFASLVQAGNPAMMMGANQALAQRLLLEAQIKNAAALNAGKAVPKAVPNGSEASDMSAHGGTAWAAAMAAMGPQFYAQMLHNFLRGLSAILHKG